MQRALYLVCYDVSSHARRRAVQKLLSAYRVEGQKSAFECVFTSSELKAAIAGVEALIDVETDRVHVLRLDPRMPCEGWGRARSYVAGQPLLVL